MAFADLLPALLSGATALFGGGGSSQPNIQQISPTGPNIPGGAALEAIGQHRTNATAPYTASPFRTIDFGHGLPSSVQQTPQFVPQAGQSLFNGNYGGGYSGGPVSNVQGQQQFGGGGFPGVSPIYGGNQQSFGHGQYGASSSPFNPIVGHGYGNQVYSQQGYGQPQQQGYATQPFQQGYNAQQYSPSQQVGQPTSTFNPGTTGLNPGDPNPLTAENTNVSRNGLIAPTGAPGEAFQNAFAPNIFRDPFVGGLNAASQIGSYSAQALPYAGAFQSSLYDPGLNAHEQSFLQAGSALGLRGLESNFNQIDSQYENTPFHSSRGRQRDDAANVFANQQLQTAGQMGMQRQQLAASNLPTAFNQPLQASQFGQQTSAGLYNLFDNAMRGDLKDGQFIYGSYPVQSPTFIQTQS